MLYVLHSFPNLATQKDDESPAVSVWNKFTQKTTLAQRNFPWSNGCVQDSLFCGAKFSEKITCFSSSINLCQRKNKQGDRDYTVDCYACATISSIWWILIPNPILPQLWSPWSQPVVHYCSQKTSYSECRRSKSFLTWGQLSRLNCRVFWENQTKTEPKKEG